MSEHESGFIHAFSPKQLAPNFCSVCECPEYEHLSTPPLIGVEAIQWKAAHTNTGYISPDYTLRQISALNLARSERWHRYGINSWSLSDWATAFGGEVGEMNDALLDLFTKTCDFNAKAGLVLNTIKKINRERDELTGNALSVEVLHANLGKELADCYLYLDLLAQAAGVDLPSAIRAKFNEVSERNGFPERLT